jgi:peptide/nickel transport system ATP-binding protein
MMSPALELRGGNMDNKLLEVRDLKKYFKTPRGTVHAVDGVNFTIERGRTLGVVGESGCGKSTLGRCILRLIEPTEGQVIFEGKDICAASRKEMKALRKEMQIIFQDPYSSINPRRTVLELIAEPIKFNKLMTSV